MESIYILITVFLLWCIGLFIRLQWIAQDALFYNYYISVSFRLFLSLNSDERATTVAPRVVSGGRGNRGRASGRGGTKHRQRAIGGRGGATPPATSSRGGSRDDAGRHLPSLLRSSSTSSTSATAADIVGYNCLHYFSLFLFSGHSE